MVGGCGGEDAGHRQPCECPRLNTSTGQLAGAFFLSLLKAPITVSGAAYTNLSGPARWREKVSELTELKPALTEEKTQSACIYLGLTRLAFLLSWRRK